MPLLFLLLQVFFETLLDFAEEWDTALSVAVPEELDPNKEGEHDKDKDKDKEDKQKKSGSDSGGGSGDEASSPRPVRNSPTGRSRRIYRTKEPLPADEVSE